LTLKKVEMKNLRTAVLCACTVLCSVVSLAQNRIPINEPDYNKQKLFASLPEKIQVNAGDLENLFGSQVGRPANLKLSLDASVKFEGEVTSISQRTAEGQQNVVVRSTNFNGATFTVSRIANEDGTVSYRGRIISFQHGDCYILQDQNGQLSLVKKNFYDLVNE